MANERTKEPEKPSQPARPDARRHEVKLSERELTSEERSSAGFANVPPVVSDPDGPRHDGRGPQTLKEDEAEAKKEKERQEKELKEITDKVQKERDAEEKEKKALEDWKKKAAEKQPVTREA